VVGTIEGALVEVAGARKVGHEQTVYNLEVEGFHSYFVGKNRAWVHNACPTGGGKGGAHLNSNSATSEFGLYEIRVNDELHKVGKADLNRVTKSTGLPTRLHQQVRKLTEQYGEGTVKGQVVEKLGQTTTSGAKASEMARLRAIHDATGKVPLGNAKSFKP
jgi:hypothetical protein